ncbi:MAG: hypothetical protein RIS87_1574 [Pseudomonadota bacterium]|jgi:hypothetical protein
MTDIKHMIEPERLGLWTAVTFVIALLALVIALTALNRSNDLMFVTQAEVLLLNKKIQDANPSAPATAPAKQEAK